MDQSMNPILWNLERAIEHLRAAHKVSKTDDPCKHEELRKVLESVNLTLGAVRQALEEENTARTNALFVDRLTTMVDDDDPFRRVGRDMGDDVGKTMMERLQEPGTMVAVPLPPPGQPNANGDVFPDGLDTPVGTKVRHEDKVVAELNYIHDNKVVVRFEKPLLRKLGDPPATEEFEVHTGIFEIKPQRGLPGVVGIRVDVDGVPVIFDTTTDHGNHERAVKHAKYVVQSILAGWEDR